MTDPQQQPTGRDVVDVDHYSASLLGDAAAEPETAPPLREMELVEMMTLMRGELTELRQEVQELRAQRGPAANLADETDDETNTSLSPPPRVEHDETTTALTSSGKHELAALSSRVKELSEEVDSREWHSPWTESTYTLLYLSEVDSRGFWYAIFVYGLQITTILLTLKDTVDTQTVVPPMVSLTVTCAQAVTIFLALAYQSDLIEAVLKLHDGYHAEILETHPGATYATWVVSCCSQLFAGLLLLTTIFILTMQVDSVLSIMLNFAALHFLADVDDLGFYIAKMGFVTNKLQAECEAVVHFKVPKRDAGNIFRRILYLAMLTCLFTGYAIIKQRQLEGYYLQTYLYIQFGSTYNDKIPYYSGLFYTDTVRTVGYRQYRDVQTQTILLAYCEAEHVWTFSDNTQNDPCDYFSRSQETKDYDVTAINEQEWVILDSVSRFQPYESFTLIGHDCDEETCKGECIDKRCVCSLGQFGLDCEFTTICPELVVEGSTGGFPKVLGSHAVSDTFRIFRNSTDDVPVRLRINNFPVYYSTKTFPAMFIFFGGYRWVMTSELYLLGMNETDVIKAGGFLPNQTAEAIQDISFHGYHKASYKPLFLSDAVDFKTPQYKPTPTGLGWHRTAANIGKDDQLAFRAATRIDTVLLCKVCLDEDGGFCDSNGGFCNATTGFCDCLPGYYGDRCDQQENCYDQERPCSGLGYCDESTGVCRCVLAYYGKLCEDPFYCFEEEGQCFHGGTCIPSESPTCGCPDPSTFGDSCEARADCRFFGCDNGGVCDRHTGKCDCEPPFHGFLCDLVNETLDDYLCTVDNDCDNGTCDTSNNTCVCDDSSMYGTLCEHRYNCTKMGCNHLLPRAGTCNQNTELCECEAPFMGLDCTELPDCSTDSDCIGPGECQEDGRCSCSIPHDYGKLCESSKDCRKVGCFHNGVCSPNGYCKCQLPYYGSLCNFILAEESY